MSEEKKSALTSEDVLELRIKSLRADVNALDTENASLRAELAATPKKPRNKLTQEQIDKIADVIWWIRGYSAALQDQDMPAGFDDSHIKAMSDARYLALEINAVSEKGGSK